MKSLVDTRLAPKPVGPYSQATVYRNMMYVSGQIGLDINTGELPEEFKTQAVNAMYNLKSVVEAGGSHMNRVLKVTVFLTSADDFGVFNELYGRFYTEDPPARETVIVAGLPKNARVEVSAIAYVREDS